MTLLSSAKSAPGLIFLVFVLAWVAVPLRSEEAASSPTFEQTVEWLKKRLQGGNVNNLDIHQVEYADGWLQVINYLGGDESAGSYAWWIDLGSLSGTAARETDRNVIRVISNGQNPIRLVKNLKFKRTREEEVTRTIWLSINSPEENLKLAKALNHAAKLKGVSPEKDLF